MEFENATPGAVLQLALGNASTWISASLRLTKERGPIKPLALKRLLESIKALMDKRAYMPTGMGAAELQVKRENLEKVQASSWRMSWDQMQFLLRMANGVMGHTG